jgi:hypothetical protein
MREAIIAEIRRIAAAHGGKPPGSSAFERATGIPSHKWRGVHWVGWSDALAEAGFGPNAWQERLDSDQLIARVADIVLRLGHVPSNSEMLLLRRSDESVPHPKTLRTHFGSSAGVVEALRSIAASDPGRAKLAEMLPVPRDRTKRPTSNVGLGYVYLIKWGDHFKIGRSDDPGRALKEIRAQLPTSASIIHVIETDDPVGIEAYWHNRFADRRLRGEWFDLSADNIRAFQRRKFQ